MVGLGMGRINAERTPPVIPLTDHCQFDILQSGPGHHTCPLGAAIAAAHIPFPARHSVVAARRRRVAAERDNKRTLSHDQL
jgi:hypothetical protein